MPERKVCINSVIQGAEARKEINQAIQGSAVEINRQAQRHNMRINLFMQRLNQLIQDTELTITYHSVINSMILIESKTGEIVGTLSWKNGAWELDTSEYCLFKGINPKKPPLCDKGCLDYPCGQSICPKVTLLCGPHSSCDKCPETKCPVDDRI